MYILVAYYLFKMLLILLLTTVLLSSLIHTFRHVYQLTSLHVTISNDGVLSIYQAAIFPLFPVMYVLFKQHFTIRNLASSPRALCFELKIIRFIRIFRMNAFIRNWVMKYFRIINICFNIPRSVRHLRNKST